MKKVPRHIGIILDGNRRFAKKLMLKPWMGHEWGAKKVEKLIEWASDLQVEELTIYAFSEQNFNRPKQEFDYLMNVFEKEFQNLIDNKIDELNKNGIRINFIGRIWKFSQSIQEKMKKLMKLTQENNKLAINFAMAYGGREEVLDAVAQIAEDVKKGKLDVDKINEKVFAEHLYLDSEPEMIIRTGGDKRTSNFLIWQSNYSEWFFIEKTWPEFEKEDLVKCINEFSERQRRFGK